MRTDAQTWDTLVGDQTPAEFMACSDTDDIAEAVAAYRESGPFRASPEQWDKVAEYIRTALNREEVTP
jgi:hypothetical protein